MTSRRRPVLNPLPANTVGSCDKFAARALSVLDHDHDPRVESSLRMMDVGQPFSLRSNHVLNCHLCSFRPIYRASVHIITDLRKVLEDEEVRNLRGGNQAHQVKVKIRITRRRHEIAIVELRVGPIEIVLPDASPDGGGLCRPLIGECHRSL